MSWNDLSMAERAAFIQLGVKNGVTSLSNIKDAYNSYANGGHKFRLIGEHSGTNYGEFDSEEEAREYMASNNMEQTFRETLPELVVTKPRTLLEQGARNFKETFGVSPRDVASFVPYIGDALDIKDVVDNIANSEYKEAALGLGAILAPNIIEKPLKYTTKGIYGLLNYANDALHPARTLKAIRERRYTPFMSKKKRQQYLEDIRGKIKEEVEPFTREIATNNVKVRNSNGSDVKELEPDALEFFNLAIPPNIEFKNYMRKALGSYNNGTNTIKLKVRNSLFGNHILRSTDDILSTSAHEYGHFWSYRYPNTVRDLTTPVKEYYGPNMSHKDIGIFSPIFKYKPGEWESSPDEVIAEVFKHKWNARNPSVINIDSPHLFDISDPIASRFGIDERDAAQMIIDMGERGYKYGGKLK